jgi:hypothetical protein
MVITSIVVNLKIPISLMFRYLLPGKLLFLSISLLCQNDPYRAILKNPDVVWAAELRLTFALDPPESGDLTYGRGMNSKAMLKFIHTGPGMPDEDLNTLSAHLMNLCVEESAPSYELNGSGAQMDLNTRKQLFCCDTVIVCFADSTEDPIRVVQNQYSPEIIKAVELRQLLFFNGKSARFDLYTYAFAPIFGRWYPESQTFQPINAMNDFWFKMPSYSKRRQRRLPDLHDPDINWVCRFRTDGNMPAIDSIRILKGSNNTPVMKAVFERFLTDPDYEAVDVLEWKPIPFSKRREVVPQSQDTRHSLGQDTRHSLAPAVSDSFIRQVQIRLIEDCYWDDKRKQLTVVPVAFAPMENVLDEEGNLRFRRPYFYQLMRGNKF